MNIAAEAEKAQNVHAYVFGSAEWCEFTFDGRAVGAVRYWFTDRAKTPWMIYRGRGVLPGSKFQRGKIIGAVWASPHIREERGARLEFYKLGRGEKPALCNISAEVAGRVHVVSFDYAGAHYTAARYLICGFLGAMGNKYTPWLFGDGQSLPGTSRQQGCILSRAFAAAVADGAQTVAGDTVIYSLGASAGAVPSAAVAAPAV